MNPPLNPHERLDDLERKGYRIIQNTKTFCFGIDAVLLAEFADMGPGKRVADLGCGNGILPLLLKARDKGGAFVGIEIQPQMARLARRNMELNGLEKEVQILEEDFRNASDVLGKNDFDAVVTNPPYIKKGAGLINPGEAKAIARHEIHCTLEDVLREGAALLKEGGSFFMVHRCWRMGEALGLLPDHGLKPRRIRLVHSLAGDPGELFLLEAKKGSREGLVVEKPWILYESPGQMTRETSLACGSGIREEEET